MALLSDKKSRDTACAGYAGKPADARIIRDKQTKSASLVINTEGKWAIYAGRTVETIDLSKLLLEGEGSGTFRLDVPAAGRSYFRLIAEEGEMILAERRLPMEGGYNFRDLGGYQTEDGRYVKWGKIFRSDDLHMLTEADLRYLSSIPLISIVDFRAEPEVRMAPDKFPAGMVKSYPYAITPGNLSAGPDVSAIDASKIDTVMKEINASLVSDEVNVNYFRNYFRLLQNEENVPILFHCSAGKDRTGMAAALTLYALGVDEDTIMDDYLSSNTYLEDKYAKYIAKYPNLKSLFRVKPEFILTGIRYIKKEYGTVGSYLVKELGADTEKLREMYLCG